VPVPPVPAPVTDEDSVEARWRATPLATSGRIHTLVLRTGNREHATPNALTLRPDGGIVGDRWAFGPRDPDAQVSLIERRVAALVAGDDPSRWHVPGDNLVVDLDLSVAALPVGTRLRVGDAVVAISPLPHAGCDVFRGRLGGAALRWINARERRDRRLRGVYARILVGGTVRVGETVRRV
jgi:hypothetical protein